MPHHVIQRGNRRQDVFLKKEDRNIYIEYLQNAAEKYGVEIWSWCLMKNHVHFVAVPEKKESLTKCFQDTHVRYTRMINFREKWRAYLWPGRFASSVVDTRYLIALVRYIERYPVRAKLVRSPWRYEFSSAAFHAGIKKQDPLITGDDILQDLITDWREYLGSQDKEDVCI